MLLTSYEVGQSVSSSSISILQRLKSYAFERDTKDETISEAADSEDKMKADQLHTCFSAWLYSDETQCQNEILLGKITQKVI